MGSSYPFPHTTIEKIKHQMQNGFQDDCKHILPPPLPRDVAQRTIDLNSQTPLPKNWDQILDLERGEVYYRSKNGLTTKTDPNELIGFNEISSSSSSFINGNSSSCNNGHKNIIGKSLDEALAMEAAPTKKMNNEVLNLVQCPNCMTCMLGQEETKLCPKCNTTLAKIFN